jgi:hypothetical protein
MPNLSLSPPNIDDAEATDQPNDCKEPLGRVKRAPNQPEMFTQTPKKELHYEGDLAPRR